MQLNKQEEKLLLEIIKKYKQGIISGLYPGTNITLTPTTCRDKVISSLGSGGLIDVLEGFGITVQESEIDGVTTYTIHESLFVNGIEIVSASRDFSSNDFGKLLVLAGGAEILLSLPETFNITGDVEKVWVLPITDSAYQTSFEGEYVYPLPRTSLVDENVLSQLVEISLSEDETGTVATPLKTTDGVILDETDGKYKSGIKYLYDKVSSMTGGGGGLPYLYYAAYLTTDIISETMTATEVANTTGKTVTWQYNNPSLLDAVFDTELTGKIAYAIYNRTIEQFDGKKIVCSQQVFPTGLQIDIRYDDTDDFDTDTNFDIKLIDYFFEMKIFDAP